MEQNRPRKSPSWRLVLAATSCCVFGWSQWACGQILSNPIPQPIVKSGLRVEIDNLVQMPATVSTLGSKQDYSTGSRARINFMRESPDGRMFVNDLRGQLYTLDQNHQPHLYVDLDSANGGAGSIFPASQFTGGLAAGFISFQFNPDFAHVGTDGYGKFYTIHMENPQATSAVPDFAPIDERSGSHPVKFQTVITEWSTPTPLADTWNPATGSRRELLRVGTTADSYFHPYGDMEFNPLAHPGDADYGKMYISGGDWGYINGAGAPQGSGTEGQPGQVQRLNTLPGTLLRIDPRSPAATGGQAGIGDYTIPSDNPFVDGNPNTFDEIYAFGFRNGHRMAWDHSDGQLYVMNVGHAQVEEIERITPGGNYGWTNREGTFINGNDLAHGGNGDADVVFANNLTRAQDVDFRGQPYLYPVAEFDHGEGNAIAGGFVYEGTRVPQLQGKYVFGDIVTGRIFAADMAAIRNVDITDPHTTVTNIQEVQLYTVGPNGTETNHDLRDIVGNSRADLRFGTDSTGEIYIMTKTDGYIRRLGGDAPPERLTLSINRVTGEAVVRNSTGSVITIDSYSIKSASGSLDPTAGKWVSLTDQGTSGWTEAGPTNQALSELSPLGSLPWTVNSARSLGHPFAPNPSAFGASVSDLIFRYSNPDGQTVDGAVEYVGPDTSNNLVLTVDLSTGNAKLKNTSPFSVTLEGYSILSVHGALQPANGKWNSLADHGLSGWQEAGPTDEALSELNALSGMLLAGGTEIDLGALFSQGGAPDLQMIFSLLSSNTTKAGVVVYTTGLLGDFNLDHRVDAADYTVWRDTLGAQVVYGTGADGNGDGVVDMEDYQVWKNHFGQAAGGGGAGGLAHVPEPSSIVLLAVAAGSMSLASVVRRRQRSVRMLPCRC